MRLIKPAWVQHTDDKKKRLPIFSVNVHPDGSRLATGGLDAKVRIWSTQPILRGESTMSKTLCTLTMHSGPVLCVRWSNSGRLLASGSDDGIVMIWDLDPSGAGKVFGEEEVNVEGWKALKRLVGHESDAIDVAWSPNDRYLASVGLDSIVYIWCGYTFEKLHKLQDHNGFVKGVCWDPVGQFIATQSDDKSVRIWRTSDWRVQTIVTEPFQQSPSSTFFRRLSWSPDGAHITASNAMNGPVFVAAVINRKEWTSDISLVGHENTVEVAAYNPHLFIRKPSEPVESSNICAVLALGSDDHSVSVWQTNSARPLIVAKEAFDRNVLDLGWSYDGLTLYACSSDGTVAVLNFEQDELEGLAPNEVKVEYLKGYNYDDEPPNQLQYPQHQPQALPPPVSYQFPLPAPEPVAIPAALGQQEITRTKEGKRRIRPMLVSQPGPSTHQGGLAPYAGGMPNGLAATFQQPGYMPPQLNGIAPTLQQQPPFQPQPQVANGLQQRPSYAMHDNPFTSAPIQPAPPPPVDDDIQMIDGWDIIETDGSKTREVAPTTPGRTKGRTLGGDRPREVVPMREIRPAAGAAVAVDIGMERMTGRSLPVPPLRTFLSVSVEGREGDVLEARNSEDNSKPPEVSFISAKTTQWLDYLPAPVLALVTTALFHAAACDDGSLNVYSPTGRRLLPTMMLDARCSALEGAKNHLMAITSTGTLSVWNVKQARAAFPPISIRHLLTSDLLNAWVRPNGCPVLLFGNGTALSYDPQLCTWHKLSDHWWSQSDQWDAPRARANKAAPSSKGPLASTEVAITDLKLPEVPYAEKPQWWSAALTLGHLESRIHAARALESPQEYKQAMLLYARRIADEGFRGKAEELIKELCGPLYWRPARDETWCPTVLGLQKRDLLRDVLSTFARSKTLVKLGTDYQELLKKAAVEE